MLAIMQRGFVMKGTEGKKYFMRIVHVWVFS